jgi:hypothetical protein
MPLVAPVMIETLPSSLPMRASSGPPGDPAADPVGIR